MVEDFSCLPKTRVRGFEFGNPIFIGASSWLSSTVRQDSEYRCDGSTSGRPVGLDYADQRYYASTYGRFNTTDPLAGSARAGDPGSWNRYSYVGGDPINRGDPHGLCVEDSEGAFWDTGDDVYEDWGPGQCDMNPEWISMADNAPAGTLYYNGGPYYPDGDDADDASIPGVPNAVGPGSVLTIAGELWGAFQADIAALTKPKCANLFGAKLGINPTALLIDLYYGIGGVGSIKIGDITSQNPNEVVSATTKGVATIIAGQTYNQANIVINDLAGVFVNGTASSPATAQNQAIVLLHELGHAVWDVYGSGSSQIVPDHGHQVISEHNSWIVQFTCF